MFQVREVEMGTRRPLMLQMVHDPTATEPRVMLQDEDSDEYGTPITPETGAPVSLFDSAIFLVDLTRRIILRNLTGIVKAREQGSWFNHAPYRVNIEHTRVSSNLVLLCFVAIIC